MSDMDKMITLALNNMASSVIQNPLVLLNKKNIHDSITQLAEDDIEKLALYTDIKTVIDAIEKSNKSKTKNISTIIEKWKDGLELTVDEIKTLLDIEDINKQRKKELIKLYVDKFSEETIIAQVVDKVDENTCELQGFHGAKICDLKPKQRMNLISYSITLKNFEKAIRDYPSTINRKEYVDYVYYATKGIVPS